MGKLGGFRNGTRGTAHDRTSSVNQTRKEGPVSRLGMKLARVVDRMETNFTMGSVQVSGKSFF